MLIAFFPIVVNGIIGLQSVEQEKIYLAQSMGASKFKTFYRVRLPSSLPSLFGGLKLAAILAVVGAVVGEFIGANKGLGRTLLVANGLLDTELLFATIGYLTVLGVGFYLIADPVRPPNIELWSRGAAAIQPQLAGERACCRRVRGMPEPQVAPPYRSARSLSCCSHDPCHRGDR